MNEELKQKAIHNYNQALDKLKKMPVGLNGRQPEAEYAQSYQVLVRMGVKPQIRAKYRM